MYKRQIFIPQVDAAGIAYLAVDHADLPMVAVVLGGGQERLDAVCHLALDSITRDLFRIIVGPVSYTHLDVYKRQVA